MMKRMGAVLLIALLSLTGCGTSTRVDEWRCQPQQGAGCVTIAEADQHRASTSAPAVSSSTAAASKVKGSGLDGILARLLGHQSTRPSAAESADVRRVPDVVARVYVAPFDEGGNYYEENFVWIVLQPSHWAGTIPATSKE
ncbi:hypothetical protein [Asticcacaulis sp.]|uniref:hypothetical protein n=1 Tax=Asticcacaulis sp. TaxID=1872648 RepID=UPI00260FBAE9|nr:hypothetical protein [Asticcacaulis sp.]